MREVGGEARWERCEGRTEDKGKDREERRRRERERERERESDGQVTWVLHLVVEALLELLALLRRLKGRGVGVSEGGRGCKAAHASGQGAEEGSRVKGRGRHSQREWGRVGAAVGDAWWEGG